MANLIYEQWMLMGSFLQDYEALETRLRRECKEIANNLKTCINLNERDLMHSKLRCHKLTLASQSLKATKLFGYTLEELPELYLHTPYSRNEEARYLLTCSQGGRVAHTENYVSKKRTRDDDNDIVDGVAQRPTKIARAASDPKVTTSADSFDDFASTVYAIDDDDDLEVRRGLKVLEDAGAAHPSDPNPDDITPERTLAPKDRSKGIERPAAKAGKMRHKPMNEAQTNARIKELQEFLALQKAQYKATFETPPNVLPSVEAPQESSDVDESLFDEESNQDEVLIVQKAQSKAAHEPPSDAIPSVEAPQGSSEIDENLFSEQSIEDYESDVSEEE